MRNRKRRDPQKKKNINKWENSFYKKAIEQSFKQKQLDCIKYYDFVAYPLKTIKQNTCSQILKIKTSSLFKQNVCTNFHNITKNLKLPIATASLLGIGSLFCIETRLPPSRHKKIFIYLTGSIRL